MKIKIFALLLLLINLSVFVAGPAFSADNRIICASTTSTQNSGLYEHILPVFMKSTGIKVSVVALGTGAALEAGKRGDADVLFVHAKPDELKLVKEGYFVNRRDIMHNDFIIAGIKGNELVNVKTAVDALKTISAKGLTFISRGDDSGTNKKEMSLWKAAGIDPHGQPWYLQTGQGMSATLRVANEKEALTITDRGTWLAIKDKAGLNLPIALEGDPALFNQYGAMAVNPEMHRHVNYEGAMKFINWLASKEGQSAIAAFKDLKGNQLFVPDAE